MVQYRARTDGQLPAKLPFRAVPVVGLAYASTMPLPRQYCKSFCGTGAVLPRYQAGCKFPPEIKRKQA